MTEKITRRNFLGLLGTGMLIATAIPLAGCSQEAARQEPAGQLSKDEEGASSMASSNEVNAGEKASPDSLVVYFSRAGENYGVGNIEVGNTEMVAREIAAQAAADTFEIETVEAYPVVYDECTEKASSEQKTGVRPAIVGDIDGWDGYETVYLGYPIWWGDMPMAVYTFLEGHDFSGKRVVPFNTHEGSGQASTVRTLRTMLDGADVADGAAIKGSVAQSDGKAVTDFAAGLIGK